MSTLLLKNADLLVTMDGTDHHRISNGGMFVRDSVIEQVGPTTELLRAYPERAEEADRIIDARGMIVLPGLVNTHHHLYQTLTRAVPAAQDATLFSGSRHFIRSGPG